MQGEKNSRKGKQRNVEKKIIDLKHQNYKKEQRKKKDIKEEERKKENTELQKPNVEAEVYNNKKKV